MVDDYIITEHHLSIYEGPITKTDAMSQYHYTAYLDDTNRKHYRLHVYFDINDHYVGDPHCAEILPGNSSASIDCQDNYYAFQSLAYLSTYQLVAYLRKQQRVEVQCLIKQHHTLEGLAVNLSKNLTQNKKNYLLTIEQAYRYIENIS